jgi:hypothetical protein
MRRAVGMLLIYTLGGTAASAQTYLASLHSPHTKYLISGDTHAEADSGRVYPGRLWLVGGVLAGTMVGIHIYQNNGWWKDNRRSFYFYESLTYGLWVDKIGHFYAASLETFVISKALQWGGLPEQKALVWGAVGASVFQTYIEIQDGFSQWGFDRVDFAANLAGAWLPVFRYHVPFARNFDLKFSYLPSENINKPGSFQGQRHLMMDDYEGQTFWLSAKVNNLLPRGIDRYWPDFLCLAVGYGARQVNGPRPHSVVFIGLDYDLTRIIPQTTPFLRTLSEALNFIRFPAPAIRISPSTITYGLYF